MRREVISAPLLGAPDSPENHGDPKVGFILRRNFFDCKKLFLMCGVRELVIGTGEVAAEATERQSGE